MTCFATVGCVDLLTAAFPVDVPPCRRPVLHGGLCAVGPPVQTPAFCNSACRRELYFICVYFVALLVLGIQCALKSEGIGVVARLRKIETDWAFFLGFGAPLAAATFTNPFFINAAIYSLAFPWLVVVASGANIEVESGAVPSRIHIFHISKLVFEHLRRWMVVAASKKMS